MSRNLRGRLGRLERQAVGLAPVTIWEVLAGGAPVEALPPGVRADVMDLLSGREARDDLCPIQMVLEAACLGEALSVADAADLIRNQSGGAGVLAE